jgi:branched-chain amino acid transport system permease protein
LADAHVSTAVAILAAGVLSAVLAGIVGVALMRLSGIAAAIATLSLLVIVEVVLSKTRALTGGSGAVTGIPVTTGVWVGLLFAALTILAAAAFQASPVGLRLRASRDEEIAARAVGVGVFGPRWVAFVVSAFFTGIGGALYVQTVGAITPDALYFQYTFLIIAMLVGGGIGSLAGAVGGALLVSVVAEVLGRLEEGEAVGPLTFSLRPGLRDVVLAAVLILVLLLRPAGLIGGREIGPFRRPKRLVTAEPPPLPEPSSASATDGSR